MSNWRSASIAIIDNVISENRDDDEKVLRKKISAAYPFGPRKYTPYKIWLSEVNKRFRGGRSKEYLQKQSIIERVP